MKPLWRCRRGGDGVRGETFERGGWGCRLRGCAHHVFAGCSVTSEAGGDGTLQTARGWESAALGSALHAAAALCSAPPALQPAFAAAAGYKTHTHTHTHTHMWRETAARRCGCTCTLLTRPRVTRSITQQATCHVILSLTSTSPGADASRRHAVATQPNMARTGTRAAQTSCTQWRGGSGCCRKRLVPAACQRRPRNHAAALMSCSGRVTCGSAACSSGSSGMLMWGSDSVVPAK